MRQTIVLLTALLGFAFQLSSQAPIIRQPPMPLPSAPQPLSEWPLPNAAPRGATLLVESSDAEFPHICRLEQMYEFHLVCQNDRDRNGIAYERPYIEAIQIAPRGYVALSGTKRLAFLVGGIGLGFAILCGSGDNHICTTPAYTGLSLLATGVVLHFVQVHLKHKNPRWLYVADGPVARPMPRIFGIRFPQP